LTSSFRWSEMIDGTWNPALCILAVLVLIPATGLGASITVDGPDVSVNLGNLNPGGFPVILPRAVQFWVCSPAADWFVKVHMSQPLHSKTNPDQVLPASRLSFSLHRPDQPPSWQQLSTSSKHVTSGGPTSVEGEVISVDYRADIHWSDPPGAYTGEITYTTGTGIDLSPSYAHPNPFTPGGDPLQLVFWAEYTGQPVEISIEDSTGQIICSQELEIVEQGWQIWYWEGLTQDGDRATPGQYQYVIHSNTGEVITAGIITIASPAQQGGISLSGCVTSSKTGAVIAGARLCLFTIKGRMVGQTQTDSQGKYRFRELNPGSYYLEITAPGYIATTTQAIELTADAIKNITLIPNNALFVEIIAPARMEVGDVNRIQFAIKNVGTRELLSARLRVTLDGLRALDEGRNPICIPLGPMAVGETRTVSVYAVASIGADTEMQVEAVAQGWVRQGMVTSPVASAVIGCEPGILADKGIVIGRLMAGHGKAGTILLDEGRQLHPDVTGVFATSLPAGMHRLRLIYPNGAFLEKTVYVTPGGIATCLLDPASAAPGPKPRDGMLELGLNAPGESCGGLALNLEAPSFEAGLGENQGWVRLKEDDWSVVIGHITTADSYRNRTTGPGPLLPGQFLGIMAEQQDQNESCTLFCGTPKTRIHHQRIRARDITGPYQLEHHPVEPGSVTVRLIAVDPVTGEERPLQTPPYTVDPDDGIIYFSSPVAAANTDGVPCYLIADYQVKTAIPAGVISGAAFSSSKPGLQTGGRIVHERTVSDTFLAAGHIAADVKAGGRLPLTLDLHLAALRTTRSKHGVAARGEIGWADKENKLELVISKGDPSRPVTEWQLPLRWRYGLHLQNHAASIRSVSIVYSPSRSSWDTAASGYLGKWPWRFAFQNHHGNAYLRITGEGTETLHPYTEMRVQQKDTLDIVSWRGGVRIQHFPVQGNLWLGKESDDRWKLTASSTWTAGGKPWDKVKGGAAFSLGEVPACDYGYISLVGGTAPATEIPGRFRISVGYGGSAIQKLPRGIPIGSREIVLPGISIAASNNVATWEDTCFLDCACVVPVMTAPEQDLPDLPLLAGQYVYLIRDRGTERNMRLMLSVPVNHTVGSQIAFTSKRVSGGYGDVNTYVAGFGLYAVPAGDRGWGISHRHVVQSTGELGQALDVSWWRTWEKGTHVQAGWKIVSDDLHGSLCSDCGPYLRLQLPLTF